MSDSINVNSSAAEAEASQVSSAAGYFTGKPLSPQDGISTISANNNDKNAFSMAQSCNSKLGEVLDKDAANIRKLGNAFEEFDAMMAVLNEKSEQYGK